MNHNATLMRVVAVGTHVVTDIDTLLQVDHPVSLTGYVDKGVVCVTLIDVRVVTRLSRKMYC